MQKVHAIRRLGPVLRRARPNAAVSAQKIEELKAECERLYPPVKTGMNVLTLGIQGANQKKRINDCMMAAFQGMGDPRTTIALNADLLWSYAEPWSQRKEDPAGKTAFYLGGKTGGDVLRSMAKGFRPWDKFQDFERKATIIGALTALSMAKSKPYDGITSDDLPTLKLTNDGSLPILIELTQGLARKEGVTLAYSLKDCAEYLRKRVIKAGLSKLAWNVRALALTLAGQTSTEKRSKVEGTISEVSSKAASAFHAASAIPPFLQAIVTEPIAIVMDAIGVGFKAQEGRTEIENARIDADVNMYKQEVEQELAILDVRAQTDLVDEQIDRAKEQLALIQTEAEGQGKLLVTLITATVGFTVVGGVGLLLVTAVTAVKKKRTSARSKK